MTDRRDLLNDFIKDTGQSKKKPGRSSAGLTPAELLTLSNPERRIIAYLARHKRVDLARLRQALPNFSDEEFETALRSLKEAAHIQEVVVDDQVQYQVGFGKGGGRVVRALPQQIWDRLKLDPLTFLRQTPLFRSLPEEELQEVAQKFESRHYRRNDVIVRQGATSDAFFIIKHGLVGITRQALGSKKPQLLAYLKEGEAFGELGILWEQGRSATVTALSAVEVLALQQADFMKLLEIDPGVSIEMARTLGQKLLTANVRMSAGQREPRLVVIFRLTPGAGRTVIGSALATTLAQQSQQPTVYTEYPNPRNLPARFVFEARQDLYQHPGGFDVSVPQTDPMLSADERASLILDDLFNRYTNIVIGLSDDVKAGVDKILERASQVILVISPEERAFKRLKRLKTKLKLHLHPERTALFTIVSRAKPDYQNSPTPGEVDFDLPFMPNLPSLPNITQNSLPKPLADIVHPLTDRLGRTHQIGVYIPTTIDVDQPFDTTSHLEKTLALMGNLFGGATSSEAKGVWESEEAGLVSETVYIVRSYITEMDMNLHLDEVLSFVEGLKDELNQEAMAVEVDQKLLLI